MACGRPNPPLIVNDYSAVTGAWLCQNVYPCAQLPAHIPVKYQVVTQFHAKEPRMTERIHLGGVPIEDDEATIAAALGG